MKVLLDECVDRRLAREIVGHDVSTVQQLGWAGVKNGELLARASGAFDAFVTVDVNLPFQTSIANFRMAVFVLRGRTGRLADLLPLIPLLLAAMPSAAPGSSQVIAAD